VPTRSRRSTHRHQTAAALPAFVQPQLSKLVKETPTGTEWLHEIKFDGYRMHARLDHGDVRLLTRTGRDWTKKYPRIAKALRSLPVSQAYLDRELCGLRPDGTTSFNMIQAASPPPRTTRFGSPLELSRVHWVRPELVVEVAFLAWTDEGLLRQVTYQGIRDDKPASEVRRQAHPGAQRRLNTAQPPSAASTTWKISRENIQTLLPDAEVPSREELAAYWQRVGKRALEYIGRRPLTLVRRIGGKAYFHEGPLPPIPPTVHQLRFEKGEGGEGTRVWVDDVAGLLGLVDMDVIEVHPWGAKVDNIECPDMLVFDLDPGEGVEWQFVLDTALRLRDVLATVEFDSWPKMTGGKGLHVVVPRIPEMSWATAREYSRTVAEHFAATDPSRYTSKSGRSGRAGKVFIDYLRNGRGNTAIGAYSPRARPGFPVAAPVTWRDVERGIRSDAFSISNPPVSLRAARRKR
jgi:bifunctional non-homologous end joining protein LigD